MNVAQPIQVHECIEMMNVHLSMLDLSVIGEVTVVKQAASGHVYFTLKDTRADAVVDCIIWKSAYELNGVSLTTGMQVVISGAPKVYPASGRLSFIVRTVALVGEGALKIAYERLKKRLSDEGVFAQSQKKPLPDFPHNVGIITSKHGAVIHDFMNNLGLHGFHLSLVDSRVEGQEAIYDIQSALDQMKQINIDVLVIMRGGGSLQSLAAFDNETLVRKIKSFPVPIIAAIGHHTDVPLMALAADLHVSTPTAAAHVLNQQWKIGSDRLYRATEAIIGRFERELARIQTSTLNSKPLVNRFLQAYTINHELFKRLETVITLNDPKTIVQKGYSILRQEGKTVRSVRSVKQRSYLEAIVSDGTIVSTVEKFYES